MGGVILERKPGGTKPRPLSEQNPGTTQNCSRKWARSDDVMAEPRARPSLSLLSPITHHPVNLTWAQVSSTLKPPRWSRDQDLCVGSEEAAAAGGHVIQ